jgi:tetratricopeptide (TPR) repeat protein
MDAARPLLLAARCAATLALSFLLVLALGCGPSASIEDARALQLAGQHAESLQMLRQILREDPLDGEANLLLGRALWATGDASLAVFPLEQAARTQAHAADAKLHLASIYTASKNFEAAIDNVTEVMRLRPGETDLLFSRGDLYLNVGQPENALADAEALLAEKPDDWNGILLKGAALGDMERLEEAGAVFARLRELGDQETEDPRAAARGCLALATFEHRVVKEDARAEQGYLACLDRFPEDPLALSLVTEFYDKTGQLEKGNALWRELAERGPDPASAKLKLAQRLVSQHRVGEAERMLRELAESTQSYAVWHQLADLQRAMGNLEEAQASIAKALTAAPEGALESLRFVEADLLIELGRLEEAEARIEEIPNPTIAMMLRGQLLLAQNRPAQALATLERALERWPNNPGARVVASQAALELGNLDQASSHLREAVRAGSKDTDAALLLARLYFQLGQYRDAVTMATLHVDNRPVSGPEAHVLAARSAIELGEFDEGRKTLGYLEQIPGSQVTYYVELANVERAAAGAGAAAAVIEQSGLDLMDPANAPALRALADHIAADGRAADASALAKAALAAHPEVAELHELQGRLLAQANRAREAEAAFDRALELDPALPGALSGKGLLRANAGDWNAALPLLEAAAEADPEDSRHAYRVAKVLLATGRTPEAEKRLREILLRDPGNAAACNDLAWLLAERGEELELALQLARRAARIEPSPPVWDTLGWVQLKTGAAEDAAQSFRKALGANAGAASIRYHLALALEAAGDTPAARKELRIALQSDSFPEAAAAKARLNQLEGP